MNSHWANLTVMITNLDGDPDEIDHVTEIITGALRSAGYKSSTTTDDYEPYQTAPLTPKEPAPAGPSDAPATAAPAEAIGIDDLPAAQGCAQWRMSNGRADVCPMPQCRRCRHLASL